MTEPKPNPDTADNELSFAVDHATATGIVTCSVFVLSFEILFVPSFVTYFPWTRFCLRSKVNCFQIDGSDVDHFLPSTTARSRNFTRKLSVVVDRGTIGQDATLTAVEYPEYLAACTVSGIISRENEVELKLGGEVGRCLSGFLCELLMNSTAKMFSTAFAVESAAIDVCTGEREGHIGYGGERRKDVVTGASEGGSAHFRLLILNPLRGIFFMENDDPLGGPNKWCIPLIWDVPPIT
ncbi:hypothetical protein C8R44DRAFT_854686 [Mycena epipterygia]|nr:hypothetical protein C8R44DRAFT_854686 [Mycena epipterygia]